MRWGYASRALFRKMPFSAPRPCTGASWAFAVAGAVRGALVRFLGPSVHVPELSVQQLLDCVGTNQTCQGGYPQSALNYLASLDSPPLASASSYPYTGRKDTCNIPAKVRRKSKAGTGKGPAGGLPPRALVNLRYTPGVTRGSDRGAPQIPQALPGQEKISCPCLRSSLGLSPAAPEQGPCARWRGRGRRQACGACEGGGL